MWSVEDAVQLVKSQSYRPLAEKVRLEDCCGRVLAETVTADRDYPPFNRSAMDGFAVRSAQIVRDQFFNISGEIFAGDLSGNTFGTDEVVKIMTGAAVPDGYDAVVRVEDAEQEGTRVKFTLESIKAGQNIALQGEDLKSGYPALKNGVRIRPPEVTLLASLGKEEVSVYKSPHVVIISTGNEIKPLTEKVLPHQIRDSNSFTLAAFFKQLQIDTIEKFLVKDDPLQLVEVLKKAMKADIVILSGGVSMGEADYVPATLERLGVEKIFHKVRLKPGKPLWFGKKEGGPVVFGLPGNPFSCQVTFKLFILPYLQACCGMEEEKPLYLKAAFGRQKKGSMEEYFPCKLGRQGLESVLRLCEYNGSGDVTATALSDGLACQPADSLSVNAGDYLAFYPW